MLETMLDSWPVAVSGPPAGSSTSQSSPAKKRWFLFYFARQFPSLHNPALRTTKDVFFIMLDGFLHFTSQSSPKTKDGLFILPDRFLYFTFTAQPCEQKMGTFIFWRARVCWSLFCDADQFVIFEMTDLCFEP
jgi:hypothetical protein